MRQFIRYIIVVVAYLACTLLISITHGLPPFYFGISVGYPSVFYYFEKDGVAHYGTSVANLLFNLLIALGIYAIIEAVVFLIKKRKG